MKIYKRFNDGVPEYLARYYWWVYLWRGSMWFFDWQPIISAILFGQYDRLLKRTLAQIETKPEARILQLTCVYGKLTPSLLRSAGSQVHLCDVATGQLKLAKRKTVHVADLCHLARMNAESLGYQDDAFDQVVVFFLFHELPPEARRRTYSEIARVVRPGGSVLVTEYAAEPRHHLLYRFAPFRWILGRLEPFLPSFWREDLVKEFRQALALKTKSLEGDPTIQHCFSNFYRVMRFGVAANPNV